MIGRIILWSGKLDYWERLPRVELAVRPHGHSTSLLRGCLAMS